MLVLSRKIQESVVIGGTDGLHRLMKVTVLEIQGRHVRAGLRGRCQCSRPSVGSLGTNLCRTPDGKSVVVALFVLTRRTGEQIIVLKYQITMSVLEIADIRGRLSEKTLLVINASKRSLGSPTTVMDCRVQEARSAPKMQGDAHGDFTFRGQAVMCGKRAA